MHPLALAVPLMRPAEVLQAECYCILRDLLRVTQERPEGWQQARTQQ